MGRRAVGVGCALAAVALAGCGSGKSSSSSTTSPATTAASGSTAGGAPVLPAGTPAALRRLHGPLLVAGELPGLAPRGQPMLSTSAQSFVAEFPPAQRSTEEARVKALGFLAAVSQPLSATPGHKGEGVSLVELYRSSNGARGEVAGELKQATGRGESAFSVAGIPGARGFGFNGSSGPNANVGFAVGPEYYLVGFQSTPTGGPTRAQLIAAAQSLYRRVRG